MVDWSDIESGFWHAIIVDNHHSLNSVAFHPLLGAGNERVMCTHSTVAIFRIHLKPHLQINSDGQLTTGASQP